jgi:hypothetical protein
LEKRSIERTAEEATTTISTAAAECTAERTAEDATTTIAIKKSHILRRSAIKAIQGIKRTAVSAISHIAQHITIPTLLHHVFCLRLSRWPMHDGRCSSVIEGMH